MNRNRVLPLLLAPLLASCQSFFAGPPPSHPGERLQGTVEQRDGRLLFSPCTGTGRFELAEQPELGLGEDARALGAGRLLFADLRGELDTARARFIASRVYRLQAEGPGCDEQSFRPLMVRASGHEPEWNLSLTAQGLLLQRPGQLQLALPYLEEQLPGGQASYSSEADGQRLELWIAPQRCVDSASGSISHLTAELRLNQDKPLRGCAYFGAARDH